MCLYSWYQAKIYYSDGDPLCEKVFRILDRLKTTRPRGTFAGYQRYNMIMDPPVDRGCEFTKVPAIIFQGEKVFEARGDETDEELEKVLSAVLEMTNPANNCLL